MATPQKVIADQLDFASGQVLDLSKLRQAEKKLVELGLFDSKDPPRIEVLKLTEFGGYYDILVVVKEIRNSEKGTPMSADPVPPKYMPSGDKSPDVRKLASPHGWSTRETEEPERLLQEAAYKNRIAELEKQVAALGGKPKSDGLPEHNTIALFAPADYGTWNPKDLADVLLKLMVDDPEAKPTHGSIQILVSKDGMISVTGSASGVDAVRTLVKKLKK